jgi:hypothetical protein
MDKGDASGSLPLAPINRVYGAFLCNKGPWELLKGAYRGALAIEELL